MKDDIAIIKDDLKHITALDRKKIYDAEQAEAFKYWNEKLVVEEQKKFCDKKGAVYDDANRECMIAISYVRTASAPGKTFGVKIASDVNGCNDNLTITRAIRPGASIFCDPTTFGAAASCKGVDEQAVASAKTSFNMGLTAMATGGLTGGVGGGMMIRGGSGNPTIGTGADEKPNPSFVPADSKGLKALKIVGGITTGIATALPAVITSANTTVDGKFVEGQCFYGAARERVGEGISIDLDW
jgi:hypothetical protein